jgi:hypothetical protein
MILMSHPRSGSNWFQSSLVDIKPVYTELFSSDAITRENREEKLYRNISTPAKFNMVKHSKNKCFKIHFSDIIRTPRLNDQLYLIENIQQIDDLYLLTRRDVKSTLVSLCVALYNNWNFTGQDTLLTNQFELTEEEIVGFYDIIFGSIDRLKDRFNFKEEFIYEDLVNGTQQPLTLTWDSSKSKYEKRNSMSYIHLIKNWDKVEGWLDQLPQR